MVQYALLSQFPSLALVCSGFCYFLSHLPEQGEPTAGLGWRPGRLSQFFGLHGLFSFWI